MIQNVAQTATTIALALCGFGAWALALGGIAGGLVGLSCIWWVSPWRPRGRFRWHIVVELAKFGIPFQLASLAPTLIGGWLPLTVSRLLGVTALGLMNWAINLASIPQMLSAVLFRVAFPALSRLQKDTPLLISSVRASIRRIRAGLSVVVPVAIILIPTIVPIIFGRRWHGAIFLVQWFCVETYMMTLNGMLCAAQSASGYASDRFWVAVGTNLLRFAIGYYCIAHFGISAIGPSQVFNAFVEVYVSILALKFRLKAISITPWEIFGPVFLNGVCLVAAIFVGSRVSHLQVIQNLTSLLVFVSLTGLSGVLDKERLLFDEVRGLLRMLTRLEQKPEPHS